MLVPGFARYWKGIDLDHIYILVEIPLKYAVSTVVRYIKGESVIAKARTYLGKRKDFTG
jgi:putative transposase